MFSKQLNGKSQLTVSIRCDSRLFIHRMPLPPVSAIRWDRGAGNIRGYTFSRRVQSATGLKYHEPLMEVTCCIGTPRATQKGRSK
jgi:hypothetical protein